MEGEGAAREDAYDVERRSGTPSIHPETVIYQRVRPRLHMYDDLYEYFCFFGRQRADSGPDKSEVTSFA